MKIFIDCDVTLVETRNSLRDFYLTEIDPTANIAPFTYSYDWDVWSKDKNIAKEEHSLFFDRWVASSYFTNIEPLENAVSSILKLKNMGHKLSVVTSISSSPDVAQRREDFLKRLFGNESFDKVFCLGMWQSKKQILEEEHPDVFIDDHPMFIQEAIDNGICSIFLNKTEETPKGAYKANDWNEVMKIIEKLNN